MARFRYTAADSDGQPIAGYVEAASLEAAREQLESKNLHLTEVAAVDDAADDETGAIASQRTQSEATSQAGQLMAAGIPLSAGLRALAEETETPALKRVLFRMAGRIEAGEELTSVFSGESLEMPPYLKGLIHAGTQMGDLAGGIEHYVQFTRLRARLRGRVRMALAYPVTMLSIGLLVMFGIMYLIMPQFRSIFDDFGVELPVITISVFEMSTFIITAIDWWPIVLLCVVSIPIGFHYLIRNVIGPPAWRRLLYLIPLFGPTLRYGSLAEYCHLLAILIDHDVPLPKALRLAGEGVSDWNLREGSFALSRQVEAGNRPDHQQAVPHFPREVLNLLSWNLGDTRSPEYSPGDVLRGAGEVYSAHAEVHSRTITAAMEPVAILMVAVMVSLFVIALFMPLVKLLNDLS